MIWTNTVSWISVVLFFSSVPLFSFSWQSYLVLFVIYLFSESCSSTEICQLVFSAFPLLCVSLESQLQKLIRGLHQFFFFFFLTGAEEKSFFLGLYLGQQTLEVSISFFSIFWKGQFEEQKLNQREGQLRDGRKFRWYLNFCFQFFYLS